MFTRRIMAKNFLSEEVKKQLVTLYIRCFLEPPWRETYFYNTISSYIEWIISIPGMIGFLSISGENKIQGVTFAYPVVHNKEIYDFLVKKGIVDLSEIIYLSEIFVDKEAQNRGIGKGLHQLRILIAKKQGMKFAVERTSPASKMFSIILKDGFTPIGGMEVMSLKNISGTQILAPDARVVSIKKI